MKKIFITIVLMIAIVGFSTNAFADKSYQVTVKTWNDNGNFTYVAGIDINVSQLIQDEGINPAFPDSSTDWSLLSNDFIIIPSAYASPAVPAYISFVIDSVTTGDEANDFDFRIYIHPDSSGQIPNYVIPTNQGGLQLNYIRNVPNSIWTPADLTQPYLRSQSSLILDGAGGSVETDYTFDTNHQNESLALNGSEVTLEFRATEPLLSAQVEIYDNDNETGTLTNATYDSGTETWSYTQTNWQWAVQAGGNGEEIFTDGSNGIIAGLNGNVYVVGTFEQEAFFGPYSVKSAGATDIFVAEINPDGTWVNVAHSGGRFYDSGEAITINKDGTIYITGTFKDLAEFGPYTLPGYNCENDIFVAKLDKNLHWIGVIQAGGWFNDHANGIISDSQGNTFITGCFSKKAMFGRKYLFHNSVLEGDGDMNIYVAKLNNLQPEQQSSRKTVLTNNIFYKEFFNTDSDHFWSMLDESGSEKITNGTLVLNNSDSKRQINSIQEFYLDYKGNYRIEAKIKHISGVDNYGFGLIWGAMGNYSYNSFLISNDGLFEVYKKEGDKIESIKDWTKNDIIRIDDDNILAIEHDGYRVKFYINDTYVWAMNASQFYKYYAAKSVGFAVLSVQKIEVDYLKISSDQEDFIYPSY